MGVNYSNGRYLQGWTGTPQEAKPYRIKTYTTNADLCVHRGHFLSAMICFNGTKEPIYIWPDPEHPDDETVGELVPAGRHSSEMNHPEYALRILKFSHSGPYGPVLTPQGAQGLKVPQTDVSVDYRTLCDQAIYIKELDISVAFGSHQGDLLRVHPKSKRNQIARQEQEFAIWETAVKEGRMPYVYANDPTGEVNKLYLYINQTPSKTTVGNNPDLPAKVELRLPTGKQGYLVIEFDAAQVFASHHEEHVEKGGYWVIGSKLHAVTRAFKKHEETRSHTLEEVEEAVNQATTSLKQRIEQLRMENSLLNQKIKDSKHDVDMQTTMFKFNAERQLAKERDQQLLNETRSQEKERAYRLEIEKLKLERERLSAKADRASVWATIAKAAAVLLPVIISIGTLLLRKSSESLTRGIFRLFEHMTAAYV